MASHAATFTLITDTDPAKFSGKVTSHLGKGWKLYKRPYAVLTNNTVLHCQAIVKFS